MNPHADDDTDTDTDENLPRAHMGFFGTVAHSHSSSSHEDEDEDEDDQGVAPTTTAPARLAEGTHLSISLPSASLVVKSIDGASSVRALASSHVMHDDLRGVAQDVAAKRGRREGFYRETGETTRDVDDRDGRQSHAATINIGVHKIMFVEHRVAVRLVSNEGNGMRAAVTETGAEATLEALEAADGGELDDTTKRKVIITGKADAVGMCERLVEMLVKESENRAMKRFYCPKIVLGAFIGRGYGHVRKIEGVSKCKVTIAEVDKIHEGSMFEVVRAIDITGTPAQVSLGYKLALKQLDEAMQTAPDVEQLREEMKERGIELEEPRKKKKL